MDVVLVGDSAANVVLGYDATVSVSIDEMLMLAAAVRRGARTPLVVGRSSVRQLPGLGPPGGRVAPCGS